jgi:hypothetical protein
MAVGEWFLLFPKIIVPAPSKVKPSKKNNEQSVLDMPLCMPDLEDKDIMFLQNCRNHSPNSTVPHPSSSSPAYGLIVNQCLPQNDRPYRCLLLSSSAS